MIVIAFASGIIAWTFLEYMLHRFLGHVHKGKNLFKTEHLLHHSKAHYFAPAHKKALAAFVVASILFILLAGVFSPEISLAFVIGLVGMYGLYETSHFRFHKTDPVAAPFIVLRKHHFYHHFHNPKINFGVTTRFWDRIFGTFVPVEKVTVPRRLCMDWLLSGDEIKPEYKMHFITS